MDRLWGDFLPVPEANLRILHGGEQLEGGFEVAYTPGHASHHVSYLHEGTAFVGDVGGVRIPPAELVVPPTPPPDIDIEAWHESIRLVAGWQPEAPGHDPLRLHRGTCASTSARSTGDSTCGRAGTRP